jgi:hypothetical protein
MGIEGPRDICHSIPGAGFAGAFVLAGALLWADAPAIADGPDQQPLLNSASAAMRLASGFHIEETVSTDKGKSLIVADVAGDDFDIMINAATRVLSVRQKSWSSQDGGKTWSATDKSDSALSFFLIAPVMGVKSPDNARLVVVDQHVEGDHSVTVLELRYDPPPPPERVSRFWVAAIPGGKSWIERFSGPETFMGGLVHVDALYTKVDEISSIETPRPQ